MGIQYSYRVDTSYRCERNTSPWNISPPSIDLHGVSVMLIVVCRDGSLYLTTQSGLAFPGTRIPTTPALYFGLQIILVEEAYAGNNSSLQKRYTHNLILILWPKCTLRRAKTFATKSAWNFMCSSWIPITKYIPAHASRSIFECNVLQHFAALIAANFSAHFMFVCCF